MDSRRIAILLSFIVIAVCMAVAFGPSRIAAAVNYIYQPPPGWVRTTYLARGLGTWVQNDQTITVSATNYAGNLNAFTRKKLAEIEALPNAKVGAAEESTVCNHHPASYIAYEATHNAAPSVFETVLAVYANVAYEATYVRGVHEPSQYPARMSLTTLCGGNLPVGQAAAHQPNPYRTGAAATPNLGPVQSSQPYGPVAPTVPPDVAPTNTPQIGPTVTP